jgi:hypothetical protein
MRFFTNKDARASQDIVIGTAIGDRNDGKKIDAEKIQPIATDGKHFYKENLTENGQPGVQKVEAVTLVWTKKELVFAYSW